MDQTDMFHLTPILVTYTIYYSTFAQNKLLCFINETTLTLKMFHKNHTYSI